MLAQLELTAATPHLISPIPAPSHLTGHIPSSALLTGPVPATAHLVSTAAPATHLTGAYPLTGAAIEIDDLSPHPHPQLDRMTDSPQGNYSMDVIHQTGQTPAQIAHLTANPSNPHLVGLSSSFMVGSPAIPNYTGPTASSPQRHVAKSRPLSMRQTTNPYLAGLVAVHNCDDASEPALVPQYEPFKSPAVVPYVGGAHGGEVPASRGSHHDPSAV